jgi:adenine-specific DNA-methyltransferase
VLAECCRLETPAAEVVFDLQRNPTRIAALADLAGRSGWLTCSFLTLESAEAQDHVIFAGVAEPSAEDGGFSLDANQCKRIFDLQSAEVRSGQQAMLAMEPKAELERLLAGERDAVLQGVDARSAGWLDAESSKLDRWAEDRKLALESELKELDEAIRDVRRQSLAAALLPEKLAMQQQLRGLEADRAKKRRELFESQDKVEAQRDSLIADMQKRLVQQTSMNPLFTIRWRVV